MPLWPEANGICERFMRNIKRVCTTANVENKNWKQELHVFLRSYRATPHSSTGVPPHTVLYGRAMRTKLPEAQPSFSKGEEMRIKDHQPKDEMKRYADHRRHAKPSKFNLVPNDQVLVHGGGSHQRKTEAYYEPRPYTIIDKKGSMVTAQDGKHSITRNSSMFKPFRSVTEFVKVESGEESPDNGTMEQSPDKPLSSGEQGKAIEERRYPLRTSRGQLPKTLWFITYAPRCSYVIYYLCNLDLKNIRVSRMLYCYVYVSVSVCVCNGIKLFLVLQVM